jgi:uncharacterized protein
MRAPTLAAGLLMLLPAAGCLSPSSSPLRSLEETLVFRPDRDGDWAPDDLRYEDVWFSSDDGTRLHGWYCPVENPRAVVLYCHGNGGNVAGLKWPAKLLQEKLGVSVFVFDYRGYGRSEGSPSEEGVLADARAARHWLSQRVGVAESEIVLLGRSLGGAVAVELATVDAYPRITNCVISRSYSNVAPPQISVRGVILENTFPSLREVAAANFWPLHWLMTMSLDSVAKIGNYRGPLLQTHGTADRLVPFALATKLFEAANEPKCFVPAPNRGHNDPPTPEYVQALDEFFASLP